MGGGTFNARAYATYSASTAGLSTAEVFKSRTIHSTLDPKGVKVRESRDSADNPKSTPLIVALDVTGSMHILADTIARQGLGVMFNAVLDRKPISDPHVMFMAVGDANFDHFPLQVSQFEADNRILEQLTQIFIEHGGGGNAFESYNLPWYFAAFHTVHDSMEKRGKRGYLFTVGDEEAPHDLTRDQIRKFLGDELAQELSTQAMLELAQRTYNVFHIIIEEGNHARGALPKVQETWRQMLGQHVISLADHKLLAETIVSTIEIAEGLNPDAAAGRWDGPTASIVHRAVKHLPAGKPAPRIAP